MKLVVISDTHGKHDELVLPEGDWLIHCGDFSSRGQLHEVSAFIHWFKNLAFPRKILIGGNHDFLLEEEPQVFKGLIDDSIIYLENSSITLDGLTIWGSPITPYFFNWAFNRPRGKPIRQYWDKIPSHTDIVITHGPPKGILDQTVNRQKAGCEELRKRIDEIRPKFHFFGHIHEAYGIKPMDGTTFVNASLLNEAYKLSNQPVVINC